MSTQTVTINGKLYDIHTGLPIDATAHRALSAQHSHDIHTRTQRSQTLNRSAVKKTPVVRLHTPTRHHAITKFAPTSTRTATPTRSVSDIAPATPHPLAQKAHARMQTAVAAPTPPKPSHILKQEAVHAALAKSPRHHGGAHHVAPKRTAPRKLSLASGALALLMLGGYFSYISMPNLSVRVAAAQAGIDASYPSYRPDGYRLNGPVSYADGEVSLKFAANAGPQNFTITQARTTWDSSAIQENIVTSKWGNDYTSYAENGLTIYTHDNQAVWVNGGIRYSIEGDAPLSAAQIRNIATSM